jgi:ABC-type oligopeptide transport system substrate-binding subunit
MAEVRILEDGESKHMKRLTFALTGGATLLLAACGGGNQDQVNNAEMNQAGAENLNELANDAAADNAEAQALGNQQEALNESGSDDTPNPEDADEQNVSGM